MWLQCALGTGKSVSFASIEHSSCIFWLRVPVSARQACNLRIERNREACGEYFCSNRTEAFAPNDLRAPTVTFVLDGITVLS